MSAPATAQPHGRYDDAARRKLKRSGRQKGGYAYIPADELRKAGYDPDDPNIFYRVWGTARGGCFIRLYREA